MDIGIVGAGWYGCHIALELQKRGTSVKVYEAERAIFTGASGNNQNRLHLGYHYPRSDTTRQQVQKGFGRFVAKYPTLSRPVENNIYGVSETRSLMDFGTYTQIMDASSLRYAIEDPRRYGLKHIEGCLACEERLIDANAARAYFSSQLDPALSLDTKVEVIRPAGRKMRVNGDLFDYVIDCTGAESAFSARSDDFIFEPAVLFLYEKKDPSWDAAITIMDGPFFSIYPFYESDLYTVSSVRYTHLGQFSRYQDARSLLASCNGNFYKGLIKKMEKEIKYNFPAFFDMFRYVEPILAVKTKVANMTDARACDVFREGRLLRVVPGKIDAIFIAFDEVIRILEREGD